MLAAAGVGRLGVQLTETDRVAALPQARAGPQGPRFRRRRAGARGRVLRLVSTGTVVTAAVAFGTLSSPGIGSARAAVRVPGERAGMAADVSPATVHVRVVGNRLVNGAGQTVRLLGVDRSGTEYACIQGWGIFDGPSTAASVAKIAGWHADAVRVPLNEDCWLNINGVKPTYGGAAYRTAIIDYVHTLNSYGLVAILDLHWNAPGTTPATGQEVMADADHSPAFWSSVASSFGSTPGVVFDLYNEPHTISWTCWLHGCTTGTGWKAAGMQTLLTAVRRAGAVQPVMAGGLGYSNDLSGWLSHEPTTPSHQLMASFHVYSFNGCSTESCWNHTVAPVAAKVPVVTGEMGDNTCTPTFVDSYMAWADDHGLSYLGWTWDAGGGWTCTTGPTLITNYTGTPTPMGAALMSHLATIAASGGTTLTVAAGQTTSPGTAPASTNPATGNGPASPSGYDLVGSDGGVFVLPTGSSSGFYGSLPGLGVHVGDIVGMVPTSNDQGYFLVGGDGGVFSFGNAPFLGSLPGLGVKPAQPITGIVPTGTDGGYFLVGRDGGVYAFGNASFLGSLPGDGIHTDNIVGIAATPSGNGYWVVASTGTVYSFGATKQLGSATGISSPVSAIAGTPTGGGYWIVTQNGSVDGFGNAKYFGSLPGVGVSPAKPVIGVVHTAGTGGYWLIGSDGGIFAFGDAGFVGSLPGLGVDVSDIVGAVPTSA
jgi:endoglucanase